MRRQNMKYGDIYNPKFLDKFGNYKTKISNILLGMKQEIDVQAVANACNISVKFDIVEHSGWSINNNNTNREIIVNQFEPEYRQRFTIAHEIGHIILGHKGISYGSDDLTKYKDTIARMNEVAANNFAAELIMPEKLVREVLKDSIEELGYSIDQDFDEHDIEELIGSSAKKINVSKQAFDYRIRNLQVFVDE